MRELARTAPAGRSFRVYIVGGGTAVLSGWRPATIDADLFAEDDDVFRDIQGVKERLRLNVEFARPEQFVPPLSGTAQRHVFIERIGDIDFFQYDPYAQLLSKLVRSLANPSRTPFQDSWRDAEPDRGRPSTSAAADLNGRRPQRPATLRPISTVSKPPSFHPMTNTENPCCIRVSMSLAFAG